MVLPKQIAEALKRAGGVVKKNKGSHIIQSEQLRRTDREILLRTRWLEVVMRGWYLLTRPDVNPGDTTIWYTHFWNFLSAYLKFHYGSDYCLNAEHSIDFHLGELTVPKKVVVITGKGGGRLRRLPYGTSVLLYTDKERVVHETEEIKGLQVMSLPYALCKVSPSYFKRFPDRAQSALCSITDISGFLEVIAQYNFKSAAQRLLGALQFLGRNALAKELSAGLKHMGIVIQPEQPFESNVPLISLTSSRSPAALRVQATWASMRRMVKSHFPLPLKTKITKQKLLKQIRDLYTQDAYNSLSIEGFQVTPEMIMKVQQGLWRPELDSQDRDQVNALAARGYYEAFKEVIKSFERILAGNDAADVVCEDLSQWYQSLFSPSVTMGLLKSSDLYGWRRNQVYIRGSRHIPFENEHLVDAMDAFFKCLKNEDNPAVRAVLGHFLFVYIHPYFDGNGRMARFLMNTLLVSGGYPWLIIPVGRRKDYFAALESASAQGDIVPFTKFLASLLTAN